MITNIQDWMNCYWEAVARQDEMVLRTCFHPDAIIRWWGSNEEFSIDEFMIANCEYPGQWKGEVERIEVAGDVLISAVHVYEQDGSISCHVVSFFTFSDDKILTLNEYWGNDGAAPEWRKIKNIGKPICNSN